MVLASFYSALTLIPVYKLKKKVYTDKNYILSVFFIFINFYKKVMKMEAMMKERTKALFAQNLMEMLNDTTFDKIRVTELAKRSGTTAQTFYYHFKDKYDLVAWMYMKDFAEVVERQKAGYSAEGVAAFMQNMDEKRSFYKKVFSSDSQNSLISYVRNMSIKLAKESLEQAGYADALTIEQELSIKYNAYGTFGLLQEWILSNEPMTTLILAEFMYGKTPDILKKSFGQAKHKSDDILNHKI